VRATIDRNDRAKAVASAPMHNSLTVGWWAGEFWPKLAKKKVSGPGVIPSKYRGRPRLNLFRRRFVPEHSCIHESVRARMALQPSYKPTNLPTSFNVEPDIDSLPSQVSLTTGQSATFAVFAALKWNDTTLQVRRGEVYELSATGTWHDASYSPGPEGYPSLTLWMRLVSPFRRSPKDPWFALIGAIGQEDKKTFTIRKCLPRWVVSEDGFLYCYANDLRGFYFNNSGTVNLTVLRMG
jgi:hypothetical protein